MNTKRRAMFTIVAILVVAAGFAAMMLAFPATVRVELPPTNTSPPRPAVATAGTCDNYGRTADVQPNTAEAWAYMTDLCHHMQGAMNQIPWLGPAR